MEEASSMEEAPEEEPEPVPIPVDFAALKETAPDAYAWIFIADTNIDYPVCQYDGEDQSFYLTHDEKGNPFSAGAIYTEDCNAKDFSDPNTLIYGHNMKNGSMFQNLHKFEDRTFFEEHPEILIYQEDRFLRYRVFAAYLYDDRHIPGYFDNFQSEEVFVSYLEEVRKLTTPGAHFDQDVELDAESRIITLSTCTGNSATRYLVQAVLVEDLPAFFEGDAPPDSAEGSVRGD